MLRRLLCCRLDSGVDDDGIRTLGASHTNSTNCGQAGGLFAPSEILCFEMGKYWGHAFVVRTHERGRLRLHLLRGEFFFGGVVRFYIVIQNLDELGDNLVALQRGEQAAVHVNRRLWFLERSREGDAEAGVF